MKTHASQRGFFMYVTVIGLIGVAMMYFLMQGTALMVARGGFVTGTQGTLNTISQALLRFAALNHRLPCPARPDLDSAASNAGRPNADPNYLTPSADPQTCVYRNGVVPWVALGLTPDEVLDEWGTMISYRVFDGIYGLTKFEGASALSCDTDNGSTPETAPANGVCATNTNTPTSSFLSHSSYSGTPTAGMKGVNVDEVGQIKTGTAFVLISHGKSALGAYLPTGARITLPETTAGDYPNTQALPGAFKKLETSGPQVVPGSSGHFDDVVAHLKIDDMLRLAQLAGRDWTEVRDFSNATTSNMTSYGTDHFLTMNQASNRQFLAQSGPDGNPGTMVVFGASSGNYSACLWWPNLLELYRPSSSTLTTGTAWSSSSGGVITFVTNNDHNFDNGDTVVVSGALPVGYNGSYTITSTPNDRSFKVSRPVNPGSWISDGTVSPNITSATWSSGTGGRGQISFVTSAAHNLSKGHKISIVGASPSGYNGTFTVTSVTSQKRFVVDRNPSDLTALIANPGAWTGGGTIGAGFRKSLMVSVDVALNSLTGSSDAGGGLVIGILPHYGYPSGGGGTSFYRVDNNSCGSASSTSRIGWANSSDGNLPSPRFGVEMDMQWDSSRDDPSSKNHVAVDYEGVTHGSSAVDCHNGANSYQSTGGLNGCYTGSDSTWLMNGLSSYHKVRVEIEPRSSTCGGDSPLIKFWLLPYSVCSGGSPPADCAAIKDTTVAFAPGSFPSGGIALSQCIPTPSPRTAYDQVFFGFTTNNNDNFSYNSTENLRLTNLKSGQRLLP